MSEWTDNTLRNTSDAGDTIQFDGKNYVCRIENGVRVWDRASETEFLSGYAYIDTIEFPTGNSNRTIIPDYDPDNQVILTANNRVVPQLSLIHI